MARCDAPGHGTATTVRHRPVAGPGSRYRLPVPSPDEMMSAVTDSMAERTGRSLEEWAALVAGSGVDPLDQNAVRRWLREVHGVKQNSQWAIADAAARAVSYTHLTLPTICSV